MKKLILFILFFLFCFTGNAQFPYVFPGEPGGHNYDDTLLNTRAILAKAGIREITVHKNAREGKRKAFMTNRMLIDPTGGLISTKWCWLKPKTDSIRCMTDSIIYDAKAKEMILLLAVSANGVSGFDFRTEFINDSVTKMTARGMFASPTANDSRFDSTVDFNYFNKERQLTASVHVNHNDSTFAWYKYGPYGFADTIFYFYPKALQKHMPTMDVFRRFERDGLVIIQNWSNYSVRKWIYNEAGQCIRYSSLRHKTRSNDVIVYYDYNEDGTLSEVKVEKGDKATVKYYYSYSK